MQLEVDQFGNENHQWRQTGIQLHLYDARLRRPWIERTNPSVVRNEGLMAKPQKSGSTGSQIIENPILANFKEGLSVLEYFISTHGARKGLADTALKTADAGYLTRRLVDVAQDVIISEDDCGTLRGIVAAAIKNNEEVVASLYDRIIGRTSVHDIYHPLNGELIVKSGDEITEEIALIIEDSPIETVEIRSVLTCESKVGVCAKCYGRNLATGQKVQKGEAVGVIAASRLENPVHSLLCVHSTLGVLPETSLHSQPSNQNTMVMLKSKSYDRLSLKVKKVLRLIL
jgi:hypothetical protein